MKPPRIDAARVLGPAAAAALGAAAAAWFFLILRKTAPGYWDEGIYYLAASRLRAAAASLDAARFLELLLTGDPRRPPLLALGAAPFLALDAGSIRAAMLVNALGWLALGAAVARTARAAGGTAAAALALWACVSAPLLFGLSRLLLVEFPLAALSAALLALAAGALGKGRPFPAVGLGLVLGAGCLLKPIFPLYAAAPLAWLWRARARRGEARAGDAGRLLAAAALLAGPWYLVNGLSAARWAWSAGFGTVAADFGRSWSAQLARLARDAGWWHVAAAAVLIVAARARAGRTAEGREIETLAALSALAPLPVFLLGVNKETRYLAPLLPAAAVWLGSAGARALTRASWTWLIALAWFGASGAGLLGQAFALEGSVPAGYNMPPDERAGWNLQLVVERLRLRSAGGPARVVVASVSRSFYPQSLGALAVRRGAAVRFQSLAYPQGPDFDADAALGRLRALDAGCVLFLDGAPAADYPPFFNRATPALRARLESGREAWRRLEAIPVAPGLRAVLFGRTPGC